MAHPHHEHRQTKVEHERVAHLTKGYASGGAVSEEEGTPAEEFKDRKQVRKPLEPFEKMEGKSPKVRADKRARGGRTKHKGKGKGTTINVINAPQHPAGGMPMAGAAMPPHPPVPMPAAAPAAAPAPVAAMPPRPPIMAPPAGAAPMMPPRHQGGRTFAKGGAVKSGPGWTESEKNMTPVQHSPNKNDLKDMGRKRVVTFLAGGRVEAPKGKKGMGPKFKGGAGGGEARLEKEERAEHEYAKA